MSYRVTAGFVTVETQVSQGARAQVDIPRGADLPRDVPAEQVDTLLRLGRIEVVEHQVDERPAKKAQPSAKRRTRREAANPDGAENG